MDRDYELQTHKAEDRHWWYRGRRADGAQQPLRPACRRGALRAPAGAASGASGQGEGASAVRRKLTVRSHEVSAASRS